MLMYAHKDDSDYIDVTRPEMFLRNHEGVKFKISTTKNQRVYKSLYYHGVQMWKTIPVDVQMSARKTDFKRGITHVLV